MSSCPVCHKEVQILDQHHGTLFTCPHCQAVFFVGWDGRPEPAAPDAMVSDPSAVDLEASPQPAAPADFNSPLNPVFDSAPDFAAEASNMEPAPMPVPHGRHFSDIVDFGNAINDQSLLTYDLQIQGIDLQRQHQILREALTDSRFRWNVDEQLAKISHGRLTLANLTPAKVVVLVQRLKAASLEIKWRQNAPM